MATHPLTIERTCNAPVQRVWQALTDKNEMKQWYFDLWKFAEKIFVKGWIELTGTPLKSFVENNP